MALSALLCVVVGSAQVSFAQQPAGVEEHSRGAFKPRQANHSVLLAQVDTETDQADVLTAPEESEAHAQSMPTQETEDRVHRRVAVALGIGGAYWPNVHKVEPNPTIFDPNDIGRPNTWGISVELAGHGRIYHHDRWDVFLGADLGFINMENAKRFDTPGTMPGTEKSRLLSQVIYVTPSLKLYYHTDIIRPFIGLGAGWYSLDLSARTEMGALIEEFVTKDAFGGYASIGIDIPMKFFLLRIEDKLHMVDFGDLGTFSPSSGSLKGPINMIHIGLGLSF